MPVSSRNFSGKTKNMNPAQRSGLLSGGNTVRSSNKTSGSGYANAAKNQNLSSGQKYQLAVRMAEDKFKDDPDVNKSIFRKSVDDIYDSLRDEGEKSAGEVRGELPGQAFLRSIGEGINTVNNGIGWFLDAAFDNTIGNVANLFGINDGLKNLTSGEDLAVIPDMLEDIALSAFVPGGIGLAAAKNALQRTDEIAEAISGRDSVTQEKIGDDRRLGKGLEAALGIGLSAVPGVGNEAAKAISKLGGAGSNVLKETGEKLGEEFATKKLDKVVAHNSQIPIRRLMRPIEENGKKVLPLYKENMSFYANPEMSGSRANGLALKNAVRDIQDLKKVEANAADRIKQLQDKNAVASEVEKAYDQYIADAGVTPFQKAMARLGGFDADAIAAADRAAIRGDAKNISDDVLERAAEIKKNAKKQKKLDKMSPEDREVALKKEDTKNAALRAVGNVVQHAPRTAEQIALPVLETYASALGTYGYDPNSTNMLMSPVDELVKDATASGNVASLFTPLFMPGARIATRKMMPAIDRAAAVLPRTNKQGRKFLRDIFHVGSENVRPQIRDASARRKVKDLNKSAKKEVDNAIKEKTEQRKIYKNTRLPFSQRELAGLPFQSARAAAIGNMMNNVYSGNEVPEPQTSEIEFLNYLGRGGAQ